MHTYQPLHIHDKSWIITNHRKTIIIHHQNTYIVYVLLPVIHDDTYKCLPTINQ